MHIPRHHYYILSLTIGSLQHMKGSWQIYYRLFRICTKDSFEQGSKSLSKSIMSGGFMTNRLLRSKMVWREDGLGELVVKMEGAGDYLLTRLTYKDGLWEGKLWKLLLMEIVLI